MLGIVADIKSIKFELISRELVQVLVKSKYMYIAITTQVAVSWEINPFHIMHPHTPILQCELKSGGCGSKKGNICIAALYATLESSVDISSLCKYILLFFLLFSLISR